MTTLDVGSPTCRSLSFMPDIGPARVSVTLTCTVDLREAAVLPVPGSMSVSASASEIIDTYREVGRGFGVSEGSGGSNRSVEGG